MQASSSSLDPNQRLQELAKDPDRGELGDGFDWPKQGLTGLKIDAAKKLIISAGWSRLFADPAGGDQPVRVDFVGSYENVSNDPQRQDRGVATLTITRKFGNLTVPLGIVYANHGEFLGDVNKQLSAHVGLKFDLGATQTLTGK